MPFTPAGITYSLFTCGAPLDLPGTFAFHFGFSVLRPAQCPTTEYAIRWLGAYSFVLVTRV